ncbi:trinucleotide repeat-containing gene 6B protein-like isoform X1 [Electrophorus electricus]|uniref:trinucleotide repeat-containing gene 6B protein-like isoform X1 n=1 Tax=Electrophorus electricus TaxID=8005 RepID=UPI0015D0B359|nr:trinucleotide repeat-containing gene 6B protein-like isoform X1 [Electrophorus electricus]
MEDLKNTREEQSHQEVSHKEIEQTFKVSTPCPAPGGLAVPPAGGNNAKRTTVANGQSSSGVSARYVPREVPPRFRNQEPKVLLRRGQPLVGGATGDTSLPIHMVEPLNANALHSSDPDVDLPSPLTTQSPATSTYANSTWALGSGAQPHSQGMDKVVVDGSDLEAWPSIAEGRKQEEPFAQSSVASWDGSQSTQDSKSEAVGPCEMGGSFTPGDYAVGKVVWGLSSQADVGRASGVVDQPFNSEGMEVAPLSPTPEPVLIALTADLDRASSESALTASHEASLSPGSAQDGGRWEDNMPEREAGPKQAGADVTDDAGCAKSEEVPASDDSNPPAPRTEGWDSGAGAGEVAGVWASSVDSQGSWRGGNDSASCGISQGGGVKSQVAAAAAAWPSDMPAGGASEHLNESFASSLQDPRMFANNAAALDNQKGADEWEGSESGSVGHRGSEDEVHSHDQPPNLTSGPDPSPEVALQSMLGCSHLDPRVLCNTGWGQTQIKQGVAWDLEADVGAESAGGRTEHSQIDPNGPSTTQRPGASAGSQVRGSRGQGWGGEGGGWGEQREERWHGREGEWRSQTEQGSGRGSNWAESAEEDRGQRWGENRNDGGRWGQKGAEWGEERAGRQGGQDEGSWGSSEDEGRRGWGGKDSDSGVRQHQGWADAPHLAPPPKNHTPPKGPNQQQTQSQSGPPRGQPDGRARPAGPVPPSQSSGWTSGPIPRVSPAMEPSGWEEPSPQSISRRLEIDDGTAAWGDPSHYDSKTVNMWEKSVTHQRPPPAPPQQTRPTPLPPSRDKTTAPAWERAGGLSEQPVDNGTAAWGKAWRDPEDSGKTSGWGSSHTNQAKSGSKSMQEGWGDDGSSSRHASWEDEDSGLSMWGGRGGSSGGWGQGQGGKRTAGKGALKGNGGDSWTGPVSRQFSNMGITDEEAGTSSDRPRRGTNDFNGDSRKGGRGGVSFRSQSSKDTGPGEAGPYFDKMGSHGMFGAGGGLAQLRGMQQPGVHSVNPSPGIRAQVPHQFLPPQVSGSMLKPMAPPSGGMFPPQLSPQHIAMLSGIHPQMQQFQLACQLLLQQQQQQQQQHFLSQRKFPPPLRPQHDPQQLARIMAILQQQRPQQGVGGPKLSPSHLGGAASKQSDGGLLHPALGGSVADLHPKTPPAFSSFGSGAELESLVGGSVGGLKEAGGSQSRFKWMMEVGHPLAPSPTDPLLHKNGLLPGQVKLRPDSPYSQYDLLAAENLGVASQSLTDTWHRTAGAKLGSTPSTPTWPPEFQPGVPWKGVQSPDPDPYMTPSGMVGSPILSDTDHQLLQDNTESNPSLNTLLPSPGAWPYSASDNSLSTHNSAKFSEFKSSWPPEPIGHNKSWRTNRNSSHLPRPPPGLTNQKQSSSSLWSGVGPRMPRGWSPGARSQDSAPFGTEATWSGGSSAGSSWLLLRNLTPQIDGSTLRTICLQHGPLMTFHLGLTQGSALIRYCSPHEAAKAQTALHMCVLGNTTILAEFVSEEEVARYFTHSQSSGVAGLPEGSSVPDPAGREGERERDRSGGGGVGDGGGGGGGGDAVLGSSAASWQGLDISGSLTGSPAMEGPGLTLLSQWSNSGADVQGGGVWGGVASGYHGSSLWGAPQMEDNPAGLFPGDLLGGGADTL